MNDSPGEGNTDAQARRKQLAQALERFEVETRWPSQRSELLDWLVEYGDARWRQGRTAGRKAAETAAESSAQWQAKRARERGAPLPKPGQKLGQPPRRAKMPPSKAPRGTTGAGAIELPRGRKSPPA